MRPHRQQPTRLPRPWDSPGKNTGVGCHFLLQCMKVKSESEVAQSCLTPSDPHGLQPNRLPRPWEALHNLVPAYHSRLILCYCPVISPSFSHTDLSVTSACFTPSKRCSFLRALPPTYSMSGSFSFFRYQLKYCLLLMLKLNNRIKVCNFSYFLSLYTLFLS